MDTYPYNLGDFTRPVTTTSLVAQEWFNRGLAWSYGFCHAEAVACFDQAIQADPACSMAHWGYAYALGPNYNKPWELFDPLELADALSRCHKATTLAIELATDPLERRLAEALLHRFPAANDGNYPAWSQSYANAMESVYNDYQNDVDVATLYADSRMNTAAWNLWDIKTGQPREECKTAEIQKVLEAALDPRHPGVLHLYIHLMEMSPFPERALTAADHLRGLIPDSGHLNHMPSHLDLLVGDYRRAIASNLEAIVGDEKYMRFTSSSDYYTFYRLHNYHIVVYAAMFNGQYSAAMDAVVRMEASLPESLLRVQSPPMADWVEVFMPIRLHVLVRFGKWEELLAMPFPADAELYCVTTAVQHYARGIAHAVLGDVATAEADQEAFHTACNKVPASRMEFPNTAADVLRVGMSMLAGEIEYRKGNAPLAFEHLREAIRRSDNLVYAEPWGWMQPPRHAYAALLLEQGKVSSAEAVYAADLGFDSTLPRALQHPNNVWALHGYHECLIKLDKKELARVVEVQLRLALAVAEVEVKSSCYCRKNCTY